MYSQRCHLYRDSNEKCRRSTNYGQANFFWNKEGTRTEAPLDIPYSVPSYEKQTSLFAWNVHISTTERAAA